MNDDYFNSSGYPDPTAYKALNNIRHDSRKRTKVYISCADAEYARKFSLFCLRMNCCPLSPHLLGYEYSIGRTFLDCCSEVWVFGSLYTDEIKEDLKRARLKAKPVRYFSEDYKEVRA